MVDFDFYVNVYRGSSISPEEWHFLEPRAAEQLARYKRIYSVTAPEPDAEQKAVCAMADAMAYFSAALNGSGGVVSSASIGSVSVSYAGANAVDLSPKGQERELYRCARQHLDIYRGCG